eukprot:gene3770-2661_t
MHRASSPPTPDATTGHCVWLQVLLLVQVGYYSYGS